MLKALKYHRSVAYGWRNREVEGVLGVDHKTAEKKIAIWQGKTWGKKLTDSFDKKLTEIIFKYAEIEMPDAYDVESALVSDASCIESSLDFKDFCWSFGYSDDSIKAKEIYNQCKDILVRLIQTGKYDELKKLHEED